MMNNISANWGEIISGLGLFAGIIAVWVRTKVDIAKLEVEMKKMQERQDRDQDRGNDWVKENKQDHEKLFDKIDEVKDLLIKRK